MDLLQLKRGSLAKWLEVNPVLASGEPGVIFDNTTALPIAFALGDGVTPFNELPLFERIPEIPEQYVLPIATKELLGGVKSGTAGSGTRHEVEIDSSGVPFVNIPSVEPSTPRDVYTKEESDERYAEKSSVQAAQTAASNAQTMAGIAAQSAQDAKNSASSAQNTANTANSNAQRAQETANSAKDLAESNRSTINNLSAVVLRSSTLGQNKIVFTGVRVLNSDLVFSTIDLVSGDTAEINFSSLITEDVLSKLDIVTDQTVVQKITTITDPISANVLSNSQTLGAISEKISPQATSQNKLLSKSEIETLISSNKGRQISLQGGSPFPTYSSLRNGPWYFGSEEISTTTGLIPGDTATVLADETHEGSTTGYQWNGEVWVFKSKTNASFTPEQEAALSSGITAEKLSQIDNSLQENASRISKEISDRTSAINEAKSESAVNLENHNKNSEAHSDIRSEIANVKTIAEGRSKGESYNDLSSMVNSLNALSAGALSRGSNVYILAKDVPDFWVYQVSSSNAPYSYTTDESIINHFKENETLQIGYYVIAILESNKVDLSGVQLKTLTETLQINGQNVTTVEGALKQLNTLSSGAKSTAESAKSIAESASAAAEDAKTKANALDSKADEALSAANIASDAASAAQTAASDALSKATTAERASTNAQETAESARSMASDAASAAQTASTNASAAQTAANRVSNDLSSFKETVESTYSKKTDVEGVQNAVNSHASEIQSLKNSDSDILSEIQALKSSQSAGMTREIVTTLPDAADALPNVIYCIRNTNADGTDYYDEYWLVGEGDSARLEFIGNSKISLEGYVKDQDLTNAINGIKHSVFFAEKSDLSKSDLEIIANYFNLNPEKESALKQNDVFIISTVSNGVIYERSAYIYDTSDNEPGWVAITGNVDAEKVILREDLVLAGSYTQIGNITKDFAGVKTLETNGKSVLDTLKMFTTKNVNPIVANPTTTFTITGSQPGEFEKGTTVSGQYSLSLNPGSYTYGPATGVIATGYSMSDGSTTKNTSTGSFSYTLNETKTLTAKITYSAGSTPVDNLGNPVPSLAIQAGTTAPVVKTYVPYTASFIGFNPSWFGGDVSKLISTNIRSLGVRKSIPSTLEAVGAQYLVIAVPGSKTSCSVVNTETNLPFGTANKVTVQVADASGTLSDYTVFYISNATAATGESTYKITIS